ncbi:hypothetical protein BTA51_04965 [Hahella sp. CCB-MM4]|uniref:hypothetical protein n=1 Tax=Hahella sp. (strain CCB-MM4) TaxID=1926491 RepID=UPI000B9B13FD|nr:hypothetical protein [Hahella sp. CCB-MM4]OZG74365.1 hypothetical protein BTA51_04965 [Hahella sp. CCB-MM4]
MLSSITPFRDMKEAIQNFPATVWNQMTGGGNVPPPQIPVHNPTYPKRAFVQGLQQQYTAPAQSPVANQHLDNTNTRAAWERDRALVEKLLGETPNARNNLELFAGLLCSRVEAMPPEVKNRVNAYSSTFSYGLHDIFHQLSPAGAVEAFQAEFRQNGMSDKAIHILGGLAVIVTDADKATTRAAAAQIQNRQTHNIMAPGVHESSRHPFHFWHNLTHGNIRGAVNAIYEGIRERNNALHGATAQGNQLPTTMFGSSATIMKVMQQCEVMGMDEPQSRTAALAVAQHWLDKRLDYSNDGHSLVELLNGVEAYFNGDPDIANQNAEQELATLGSVSDNPGTGFQPVQY